MNTRTMPAQPLGDWITGPRALLTRMWAVLAVGRGSRREPERPRRRPRRFLEVPKPEAAPAPRPVGEDGELPESYERNRVVLMVVSPYLVHAYWDLERKQTTSQPACLRFHDTTAGQPASSFDVPVNLPARNWYVHLWGPARQYHVELGILAVGGFEALARSNTIETPRAWPVAEVRERFLRVEEGVARVKTAAATVASPPVDAPLVSPALAPPRLVAQAERSAPVPAPSSGELPAPLATFIPRAVDAGAVLRQRLTELYAFRWWRQRPAGAPAPTEAELYLPVAADLSGDLTSLADSRFSPGHSSSLLGLAGSKKPAG